MANSWNLRLEDDVRGSIHEYSNNSQIACRLCNRVFMTNQGLIAHIHSHMVQEETELRRLSSLLYMNSCIGLFPNPNRHQTSSSLSIPEQEDMIFSDSRTICSPSPQPAVTPLTTRNQFSSASRVPPLQPPQHIYAPLRPIAFAEMNDVAAASPLTVPEFHRWRMEESQCDKTKPYIMLLDQPIKKIEIIDLDGIDDSIDLALKL